VGENKVGESEDEYWGGSEHRRKMEYGQGVEEYEDREIRDGLNKPVRASAEAREQRALAVAREHRALAEAWEQPYQAGRTHSAATPAKSGGKVQRLVKIPVIGSGHSGSAHLPPSNLRTKASVSKAGIVATRGVEPDSSSQSIPLDRNAIIEHYAESSPYKKRGRSASPESQHNKSQRISALQVLPLLGTLLQFSVGKGVFMTFPLWLIMILKGLLVPLEEYLEGGHWKVALDLQMLVSLCLCSCQHIITSLSLRTNGC